MKFVMPIVATAAVAVGALALAGAANAAPSGNVTAPETVSALQAQGLHVIVSKIGAAPLDQCVVDSVRPGQTYERMDSGAPGAMRDIVTTVTERTVYVDLTC
jgi:hypothetical protein